ncbi:unnamed protein product [Closterium sp. NIES-54]
MFLGPTDSFAHSCPKRPCAVRPYSHSVALPCSYLHCLPPSTSRPAAACASRSAAPRLTPCCSLHVAPCCPAHHALLQPERRALLPCASRPAAVNASRPTSASGSRSAARRIAPCCSQRVAPCCPTPPPSRPAATTAAAAARATAAAGGGAAGSAGSAVGAGSAGGATGSAGAVAAARGGQRRSPPLPDDPTPQQLREWVLQRARPGGGGFGFLRTTQRRQQSQHETFSPQVLSELFPRRCVTGSVEAAALGASESAAAVGARASPPQLEASCSCRVLSHQTLLWHYHLSHPSLPRLRSMHSRLLVSGLPRSLPSLPRSPSPPCLPCVEGRQRAAPHSSEFPPTTAPLQTLHMDVWGTAPVGGTDKERYFLLVVDDYTRYTTIFPLRRKADVNGVLIPSICATRRQLRERFS